MAADAQTDLSHAAASLNAAISSVREFPRSVWMELLRRDQCERWRSGRRTPVEIYIDLLPELSADREDILILISGEVQLRREIGEACTLREYQTRFPELADDIALQFDLDPYFSQRNDSSDTGRGRSGFSNADLPGYEIFRELGRGASGVIYLARRISLDRLVAVKAIPLSAGDPHRLSRQRREASILSRLQHPHVVQIYDVIETPGMLYLIIEYVNGPTLTESTTGSPQPPQAAARLVLTLAEAIHVVHEAGVLHRDLKPSNILLTSAGEPKITDFGLAKLLSNDSQLTTDNCLLGTPCYMPPEQASGSAGECRREGDVYSLGAILYELLTGRPPFRGVTVLDTLSLIRDREPVACRASQPQTPRDLETICLKCLAKAPQERYETAAALADDLSRFLDGAAIKARPPSRIETAVRWCRRRPAIAGLGAGLLVAILAGFGGILWQWNRAETERQLADQQSVEIQRTAERLRTALVLVERGHTFRSWRRWDDAVDALDEAIRLCPELRSAWEERGSLFTEMGLWDYALADRRQAFELNEPALAVDWWSLAVLMVEEHDQEGYRRLCARMGERFSGYSDQNATDCIRAECLLPGVGIDYGHAEERLRATPTHGYDPLSLYVRGLVQLRAGKLDSAASSCLESLQLGTDWKERALNYPLLALANAKRGAAGEARAELENATSAREHWIQDLYTSGDTNWIGDKGMSAEWGVSPSAWLEYNHLYDEARSELHQPPANDDVRLIVLRARALAAIDRSDAADASYRRAIALDPGNEFVRAERQRCEAYRRVKEGDFARGADEFAAAIKTEPTDVRLWVNSAHAHLAAGMIDEYRRDCREMLRRFRVTKNPADADLVVWSCVARPDALPSMEELLPLADLSAAAYPGAARTRGAALVRAGRCEEALREFDKAARFNIPNPSVMCLQAIAGCRLGQIALAREHLDAASRWIAEADRRTLPDIDMPKPCWGNLVWYDHQDALRLLDEANRLLANPSLAK
ncbi:MAG TPA: protein kinase [Pirellulales bacterium]|nr:protein kinase [Pirellulales bacterium]